MGQAIETFMRVVSAAGIAVATTPALLDAFAGDASGRRGAVPLAVVYPRDTEQLQTIVARAVVDGVPLIPVSSRAGPRRRGDTISDTPAVIVDLSRMARVIHVDGADAIALIEAGVTFAEFAAALAPHQLRPYQPLMPRASKSVVAAFLEREPTTVPGKHWDSADPLAAMEVVFGTGDVFRTGGASIPGRIEDSLARGNRHMFSLGPSQLDLGRVIQGSQGALAVVAWSSIYCQRIPARETALFAAGDRLEPLIDLCYRIVRRRIDGQLFILNNVQLALLMADTPAHYDQLKASLPPWTLYVELTAPPYFADESMAYQRGLLDDDAARLGVALTDAVGDVAAAAVAPRQRVYTDQPAGERVGRSDHDLFFMTQLDKAEGYVRLVAPLAGDADCGVYLQPMTQGVNAECQFTFVGARGTEAAVARTVRAAAERSADAGAFFSRPYHPWADLPFRRDRLIVPMLAKTKNALDPAHILQPGALSLGAAA